MGIDNRKRRAYNSLKQGGTKMKRKQFLCMVATAAVSVQAFAGLSACGGNDGIVIYVDGGGANGNFNTTASMDKTPENPYPYNTLETLANEYMADHPGVTIIINKQSLNSDRETIVSLLTAEEAPHLLYQISPDILSDARNGWIIDLTDYLNEPNEYCAPGTAGSEKWADIYNEKELLATSASDGKYYSIMLEKIPIGILYNKDMFEDAGLVDEDGNIIVPETFGELLDTQKTIYEKLNKNPYFPIYTWYDIALEVSVFADLFPEYDTIEENGFISLEEIVKAYNKGIWGISSTPTTEAERRYREYFRLMKEKTKYYPNAWTSYDALEEFLKGDVAMIEATGGYMAQAANDSMKDFEVGVFGFPTLTKEDSQYGGSGVYRGTAGLCTGYFVTNAAVRDGQETVDACVDFLKFLTAPQNNDRLINDLGLGLPLSPDAEINELFQPLVDIYQQDCEDPNRYDWNTYCTWNDFNKVYYDTFLNTVQAYEIGKLDIDEALDTMAAATKTAVDKAMSDNGWTVDRWN